MSAWRPAGKQLVVRPVLEAKPSAHAWSLGASNGEHAVRLDGLEEGLTRLLACPALHPAPPPGAPLLDRSFAESKEPTDCSSEQAGVNTRTYMVIILSWNNGTDVKEGRCFA